MAKEVVKTEVLTPEDIKKAYSIVAGDLEKFPICGDTKTSGDTNFDLGFISARDIFNKTIKYRGGVITKEEFLNE